MLTQTHNCTWLTQILYLFSYKSKEVNIKTEESWIRKSRNGLINYSIAAAALPRVCVNKKKKKENQILIAASRCA